ncbi:sodium/potassium/calcium exchanger Nckx30C [Anopheles maculipalpis]|uniref:sodium/potassium/calcium exchanger Nckx30C n=1 Tax=Anopheles maculipalpis TaxID=1496333 RepID=UPI002159005D|nr:sodium/potassium/calcium exchanger Nckx30C [Anopheles maculipalpis]
MKPSPLSLLSSSSSSYTSRSSSSLPASVGTMHQQTAACRSRKPSTTTTATITTTAATATTTITTVDNNNTTTATTMHRAGTGVGSWGPTEEVPLHPSPSPSPPTITATTKTTTPPPPLPVPTLLPSCAMELHQDTTCHRRRRTVRPSSTSCSSLSTDASPPSSSPSSSTSNTFNTTAVASPFGSKANTSGLKPGRKTSHRCVPWGTPRLGVTTRGSRLLPFLVLGLGLVNLLLPASPASAESLSDMALYYDQNSTSLLSGTTLLQLSNATFTNKTAAKKDPLFPSDLFTEEQLRNGAIVLHVIGVIYMFVALAIVCDEFFVPSLDVIIEKLGITDDVAGATFMAAGGSAPELFTSIMGVFVSFNDVGIGTIVGSAVFNILFVIGMCALFSKTILSLTWWPLFRDCTFYSVSLLTLIYFFRDNKIYWWEALVLFIIYILYAVFMKFNQQVERCVKKIIYKNKVTRVRSTDQLMPAGNAANSSETSMATQPGGSVTSRAASESRSGPPGSSSGSVPIHQNPTATGAKFRHGLLQLMIHTIDPLHDDPVPGKVDEKATQLHAIASLKVLLDATKPQRGAATSSAANHVKINLKETTLASDRPNGNIDTTIDSGNELEEEPPEALSMSWPKGARKRITYLLVAPIIFPLYLTLPDTRTPRGKKFFPVTFIGSIVWIAAYSYLMVWWATVVGDTSKIPAEVMGLTFLAAGTSIPDLITSVIVARKGFGDMAVSSSVGSNIFDVTVGLPIPWLMYGIIYGQPVEVNSVGMVCSITILFLMLLFVVMSIACFRWRMNKGLGFTMFLLYFAFVAVSLMFEYDVLVCPF